MKLKQVKQKLASFLEKNLDNIVWDNISNNSSIPFDFFKNHLEDSELGMLSSNKSVPFNFFKNNLDYISWPDLCYNQNLYIGKFFVRTKIYQLN